jgi:hypothetical protein
MKGTDLYQDDDRDRTAFIEYFKNLCLTSVWHNDGRLDYYVASHCA